jgi:hypothetical protein
MNRALTIIVGCAAIMAAPASHAFYQGDHAELQGFSRMGHAQLWFADDTLTDRSISVSRGSLRLLADVFADHWPSLQFHGVLEAQGATFPIPIGSPARRLRASLVDQRLSQVTFDVDRLALRYNAGLIDIQVGRQPVNLATTFFFTPNDFFNPFAAQAFFRIYKPGVDALRLDLELGELSRLTVISALGDEDPVISPSSLPSELRNASALAQISTVVSDVELSLVGGRRGRAFVVGGALAAEVLGFGVRSEGHVAFFDDAGACAEVALGVERRFENTLNLQLEAFYHGAGADQPTDVSCAPVGAPNLYRGRYHLAAGAGYEINPLLQGQILVLVDASDGSAQGALYFVYSLHDEVEAALVTSIPIRQGELGATPFVTDVELRAYF